MNLVFWFLLLVIQNASFTWVSRARNSGSLPYHAIASVFSNGIWFASQCVMFGIFISSKLTMEDMVKYGIIYVTATVTGSLLMHWVSMKYLETGKRKVGA